jgi:hypothetical protein
MELLIFALRLNAKIIKAHLLVEHGPLECLLVHVDELCPDQTCDPLENDGWKCNDERGLSHIFVGLSADFFSNNILRSGQSVLSVSSATMKRGELRNEIIVDSDATLSVQIRENGPFGNTRGRALRGRNSRNLQRLNGTKTVLVVYIVSLDSEPTYDFDTVVNDVLGSAGDTANMVSKTPSMTSLSTVPASPR